jgi:hypothetical protein
MKKLSALFFCLAFAFCLRAQVNLGTSANFGVLAATSVSNTGPTTLNGIVGVSPGTSVTGFPPGTATGGIDSGPASPAAAAEADATTAYNAAGIQMCTNPTLNQNAGGTTILPGVSCAASSLNITGTVTLNGGGNPNAVFIIQIPSALTVAGTVLLTNGAQAGNVFWQVGSSATLGTGTNFSGTILALISVTLDTGTVLTGRALALTGGVTLDDNTITLPLPSGGPLPATPAPPTLILTMIGMAGVAFYLSRKRSVRLI